MKAKPHETLLQALKLRFEQNMHRHRGLAWSDVQAKLEGNAAALKTLLRMEETGGEPDVIASDAKAGQFTFCDCAAESPAGRRSLCYDREALDARKENKPAGSAAEMAADMGIALLTEEEYRALQQQFEGDIALEFFMAPPTLARAKEGQPPRKVRLGGWMMPFMKLLAQGRRLRGTPFDLFGRTAERRLERELVDAYRARIEALLPALTPERLKTATEIAALPLAMRGFGHVKLANVALARAREAELLHRFDPSTYARPAASRQAGQIRGIRVTAAA
jgi:hypothetical protein